MAATSAPRRLGLLVNPIAGMGGRVALKGTDGPQALALARARGAVPIAGERAVRALARLRADVGPASGLDPAFALEIVAAPGPMGVDVAAAAGLAYEMTGAGVEPATAAAPAELGATAGARGGVAAAPDAPLAATTAADTRAAARAMRDRGVDLLLFAGGDGTARDIHDAIGDALPLVGVPTGVKMHSAVFAATPDAAGAAAAAHLRNPRPEALVDAEIADVDEEAARDGRVSTRLYGRARVPRAPALMVAAKAPSNPAADRGLEALTRELAATLPPGRLTVLGPGTTTARILEHLGQPATLLGVDALRDGRLVGADLDEAGLLALLDAHADAALILGVVGGQGALLGRGNQQLSPAVLRRIGRDRIQVVAAADKLLQLNPPLLRVDTGDDALDAELSGHLRVDVAPGRTIVMKVST